jgi:hypothetical protein
MPCNGGHSYSPPDHTSCEEYQKALVDENDELTRLLCFVCGWLTGQKLFKCMPAPLVKWWKAHQEEDRRRVTRQMDAWLKKEKKPNVNLLAGHFITAAERKHPLSNFHAQWLVIMAKAAVGRYQASLSIKERKQQELERALAKLTPDERKLLGIKKGGGK